MSDYTKPMTSSSFTFTYHKYPILPVKFYFNGRETPIIDALLDSGGDFIVIPMPIAAYLGLKLKKAGDVDTAGGTASLYKSCLDMGIGGKSKIALYENIEICVSDRDDLPVLLGRHPIFEDFEIIFNKNENQLILKPNIT